jgi:hypothetical protein
MYRIECDKGDSSDEAIPRKFFFRDGSYAQRAAGRLSGIIRCGPGFMPVLSDVAPEELNAKGATEEDLDAEV